MEIIRTIETPSEFFQIVVQRYVPEHFCSGWFALDCDVKWDMWFNPFLQTICARDAREAVVSDKRDVVSVMLIETFISNIAISETYVGNCELQIMLHDAIYMTTTKTRNQAYRKLLLELDLAFDSQIAATPRPIDHSAGHIKILRNRFGDVFEEVLRRFDTKHSPVINNNMTYGSTNVMGVDEPEYLKW